MRVAIFADSHDNLPNIYKALDYLKNQGINLIIHCGDVCAPSVMKEIAQKFKGEFHLIFGNVDGDQEKMRELAKGLNNLTIHGQIGELILDRKKIAWCHYPWQAEKLAQTNKYEVIFYGHDHKPWEKQINKTKLLNPGTLAGLFAKATFAIYDTKSNKAQLILLEKI